MASVTLNDKPIDPARVSVNDGMNYGRLTDALAGIVSVEVIVDVLHL
ncbi:MAG: hypothetical protein ACI841_001851 [Planctomycetota bacterium]|jgi:hypothetical protein